MVYLLVRCLYKEVASQFVKVFSFNVGSRKIWPVICVNQVNKIRWVTVATPTHLPQSFYPRATRCGGDIVTLLWFRPSVRPCVVPSVRPCIDLVNTIETKLLHVSLSHLADMLTTMRGWTLLILKVRGQRSRSQLTYMEISLWTR